MPSPFRLGAKIALVLTLVAPLATAQNTDNTNNGGGRNGGGRNGGGPGGGGWGGGPGGGGPGGGGWGGGPGGGGPGGGTTPTALIQTPVVQDDLKMTDKQKDQVKQITADAAKKRTQVQANAEKMAAAARQEALMQAAAAAEAGGGTPFDPNGNGNGGNNGGGRGGNRGGRNDPGNQVMRQAMDEFASQVEAMYLKVLDAKQKTRIKQIALQAEGAGAFDNPEVIEKLGMTQEQVEAIQNINNESRNQGRQLMGQLFNNGGNNNGGPGGGGGRPDPATFQTPEFQAKLKTVQEGQTKLTDQTMATVAKALTKAQRATFQKMVGDKFDVSQLRQGFMARFQPPAAATETASAAKPTAAATTATPATAAATTATPSTAAATTATTTPAKTARKSLRDQRAGSPQP